MKFSGLSNQKAQALLHKYGANKLPEAKQTSRLQILINQVKSPLIYILIIAAGITFFLHDLTDSLVIFAAVLLNTVLGFYQESKAESSLAALNNILSPTARVIRDSKVTKIEASQIVPGDYVILSAGNRVPADGVVVDALGLMVEEAILTGENVAVEKASYKKKIENVESVKVPEKNHVYMGTTVISGKGVFLVLRTGSTTKMGSIAHSLISVSNEMTPLQKRMASLAKGIAIVISLISAFIFFTGIFFGNNIVDMFATSVAIAVAAIPEGMVVTLTVILAIGMQKILKRKALVRKLIAAETLGSVTVIATDKTGTLTEGKMRVNKTDFEDPEMAVQTCVYANDLDDPIELAIWQWSEKQGADPQKMTDKATREHEKPFNSVDKYMSVTVKGVKYVKGAPEVVLEMCDIDKPKKKKILKQLSDWSSQGLRVLGLAAGGKKLKWVGLIGVEDPLRDNVADVVKECNGAGIRIIMITGDYEKTAAAIWHRINAKTHHKRSNIIDGAELAKLSDKELDQRISKIDIFARVSPDQKLKIIQSLQRQGEVVALMGDGVNDAPAIKQANIGIVVGEASDVARETADMVLLDSNFKTIVAAIEEGRGIFKNIKKNILYLLSDSFSEVILVTGAILFRLPLPLTAAQILWINLITDGFPNLALTVEPHEKSLMRQKPLPPSSSLIDNQMKTLIVMISIITGLVSLTIFYYYIQVTSLTHARSIVFALQGVDSLFYIFSIRSLRSPLWSINQFNNVWLILALFAAFILQVVAIYVPFFTSFLTTIPLGLGEWLTIAGSVFIIVGLIEAMKLAFVVRLGKMGDEIS